MLISTKASIILIINMCRATLSQLNDQKEENKKHMGRFGLHTSLSLLAYLGSLKVIYEGANI